MENVAWMAWTPATAAFFATIAALLAVMTVLAVKRPERPRVGILSIATTRGDRLFVSLLGAAFIHLIFLALFGADTIATVPIGEGLDVSRLWLATALSLLYAGAVFRWV